MKRFLLVVALLLLALWARSAVYTVDQAEYVYVTRFGERVAVHDGAADAGLKVKAPWPVDAVIRIDRRVQSVDLPAVESLTRDPVNRTVDKTLAVDAFVTWKVPDADAADRFVKAVRTPEQANKVLGPLINGRLAALISTLPLDDLIGVTDVEAALAGAVGAPAATASDGRLRAADLAAIDARTERVRRRLLGEDGPLSLKERALAEYGIQILDVRVRRFGYPPAVQDSIHARIRSERERKVTEYQTEARKRAAEIAADADRAARTVEADARARKTVTEGEAAAEAGRVRSTAYAQDRDFYLFLEKLRSFQAMLADTRDVLLLSTKHPLFDVFRGPPMAPPPK
jgi:membrane protease subunit HflC